MLSSLRAFGDMVACNSLRSFHATRIFSPNSKDLRISWKGKNSLATGANYITINLTPALAS